MPTVYRGAPAAKKQDAAKLGRVRPSTEVNPIPVIVIAVILAAGSLWFFWIGPTLQTNRIVHDWNSPAAAAARAPENRPKDPTHEAMLQQLRGREGLETARIPRHRRD